MTSRMGVECYCPDCCELGGDGDQDHAGTEELGIDNRRHRCYLSFAYAAAAPRLQAAAAVLSRGGDVHTTKSAARLAVDGKRIHKCQTTRLGSKMVCVGLFGRAVKVGLHFFLMRRTQHACNQLCTSWKA